MKEHSGFLLGGGGQQEFPVTHLLVQVAGSRCLLRCWLKLLAQVVGLEGLPMLSHVVRSSRNGCVRVVIRAGLLARLRGCFEKRHFPEGPLGSLQVPHEFLEETSARAVLK